MFYENYESPPKIWIRIHFLEINGSHSYHTVTITKYIVYTSIRVGADKKKATDKSSGTVGPGGGNNEPNSRKILENSGKLWTNDFEKYIQHRNACLFLYLYKLQPHLLFF